MCELIDYETISVSVTGIFPIHPTFLRDAKKVTINHQRKQNLNIHRVDLKE
jgi:hypothetical protein